MDLQLNKFYFFLNHTVYIIVHHNRGKHIEYNTKVIYVLFVIPSVWLFIISMYYLIYYVFCIKRIYLDTRCE